MYPNPQDVLPLPPRPDLHHYRKRAKDLAKACRSGDAGAMGVWAERWVQDLIALQPEHSRPRRADADRRTEQVATFAGERLGADCSLNQAQFVIARAHGFESWPRLSHHLAAVSGKSSPISAFEDAADAIVTGDRPTLERLLAESPELIGARSDREHRATLLHYVSANGVENYRQETPANIVEIARLLLDAGADVNAEADVYGGGATTLGLVVTSAHPRAAGVQNELADLLLDRGARLDKDIVRGCLMNGCPEAAEHMVQRGAALGLEEAAGIGRLDLVREQLDGRMTATSQKDLVSAALMATWYDHDEIVAYLLDRGLDAGARGDEGQTTLHLAAYEGKQSIVELLLRRGAPVNVTDDTYRTPPLVWALHAWLVEGRSREDVYRRIVRMLVDAGATVQPEWIDDGRVRADGELYAALSRAVTRRPETP